MSSWNLRPAESKSGSNSQRASSMGSGSLAERHSTSVMPKVYRPGPRSSAVPPGVSLGVLPRVPLDGQVDGQFDRRPHAARVGPVAADDVERCAVVGAGADDG